MDEEEKIPYRSVFPKIAYVRPVDRNDVLEVVAREIEKLKVFGDTAASFAVFVRDMKR